MRAFVCLLSAFLLSARADTDVPITQHWSGGFNGEACVPITEELHAWTMTLTFDQAISSIDVWQADIAETKDGGKVYVLKNKEWNKEEHVGDKLCITFQGHANGDIAPKVTARVDASTVTGTVTGSNTTPGALTAAPGQTLKPTNPPGTFTPGARLEIKDNYFTYDGKRVFLNGGNLPWISYAYDFGEGQWQYRRAQAETQYPPIDSTTLFFPSGLWIHIQGETTPIFDSTGLVTGLDTKGTFIDDIIDLLNLGQQYDVLIFPTLWNAAVNQDTHNRLDGLIKDPVKLQSYIDKALIPWAKAVKGHPALGGWDIMNEPEGMLNPEVSDPDPCFDTTALKNSGAGWAGKKYDYKQFLRFLNWQTAAIKSVDPNYLVSVGVSNPKFNTDKFGWVDHYSDTCLIKAGGKATGIMDFFQFHSYSWQNNFDNVAAFKNSASDYGVTKPILVGEFWEKDGGGMKVVDMFKYIYDHGYAGAWSWDLVGNPDQYNGIAALRAFVCLLSAFLLSTRADTDVPITQHWNGGFNGEACVPITQELHAWTMTLTFENPVTSLDVWAADVAETKDGGKVYVLKNKDWNKDEHPGDKLCIIFTAHSSGDVVPKVTARVDGTSGGGPTQGPLTAAPGQTLKPTNPPGTFTPGARLEIKDNYFTYDGKRVFLNGGNLPWISYAYDFGEGQWQYRRAQAETQFRKMKESGANSLRLWIHIQGETTPIFDSTGLVTGLDTKGTFINDIIDLLNLGQQYDVLIFPTLWNAAVNQDTHNRLDGLIKDPVKLQSYIDKALIPWAKAVKGHPALGGWDIMNEPEGMLNPEVSDPDPCFDTTALKNSGAGWAGKKYDYKQFLRFLNWQTAAIKSVDPNYLVSVGVSNPKFNTDKFGWVDHYSDTCLIKAGGKATGVMDFFQFHSYSWQNNFDNVAAFKNSASDYGVTKPILVGEFWEKDGGGMKVVDMFKYIYDHGYAGAWSWDLVGNPDQYNGIAALKDLTSNGPIPLTVH
ncbi:unnamed protein product [Lymnaea stagnalis]|uniref:CBM2 domain-containing protein n=1 Tax=Lymnaea stagnalis TaxID=6523 RepID=A0AAV2I273_LYMST